MSDTIVVMNSGKIQQIGTSWEIYNYPQNQFVADFIGMKNFLEAIVKKIEPAKVILDCQGSQLSMNRIKENCYSIDEKVLISIRLEDIKIYKEKPNHPTINLWKGIISKSSYLGKISRYWVRTENGHDLIVEDYAPKEFIKADVYLDIDEDSVQFIQKE